MEAKRLRLHALVLAAGRGSRFGGSKLQAAYRQKPLLSYPLALIAAAQEAGLVDRGYAVIRAADDRSYREVRDMKLVAVRNSAPDRGLSYSLQLGLAAIEGDDRAAAVLIFLGDQPLVRLEVVAALISAWSERGGPIIRPRYEASPSIPGHPVLVERSVWPLIGELKGDGGFQSLNSRLQETFVDVLGSNPDVNTPLDLQALEVLHQ